MATVCEDYAPDKLGCLFFVCFCLPHCDTFPWCWQKSSNKLYFGNERINILSDLRASYHSDNLQNLWLEIIIHILHQVLTGDYLPWTTPSYTPSSLSPTGFKKLNLSSIPGKKDEFYGFFWMFYMSVYTVSELAGNIKNSESSKDHLPKQGR